MSSNLDMLYQEYDRALDEIKIRDQKLTSKMKEIHFWFKAAQETSVKIEGYHEKGVQLSEARTDMFKATKKEMRRVRDEMKDLFDELFVEGWPQKKGK